MNVVRKALQIIALVLSADAAQAQSVDHYLAPTSSAGAAWSPRLLLREQTPATGDRSRPVLYVHGATFPSSTSMMFRFAGKSWADSLNEAGFDVFALDFAGYGGSDRYPEMSSEIDVGAPLGRAPIAADQIQRAVEFIVRSTGAPKVDIIAHSWGSVPAGLFAGRCPDLVGALVLFGPIGQREGTPEVIDKAWQVVTVEQQHARFVRTVPRGEPGVLVEHDFPRWGQTFLDSDVTSRSRTPASVRVPMGPSADVTEAWAGRLPYDPTLIQAPTLIIRGEWDTTSPDADMAWLASRLTRAARVETVKVPKATHLMHLETGRTELYRAVQAFLGARHTVAIDRRSLFAVVFEVSPNPDRHEAYLQIAGQLRPLAQATPGFVMNERYQSLEDPGRLLSLSLWDDEKALIRWRAAERHHQGQSAGRSGVLVDYRLRVGEVTKALGAFRTRRLGWLSQEETAVSEVKALVLIEAQGPLRGAAPARCQRFQHLVEKRRTATLCEFPSIEAAQEYIDRIEPVLDSGASAYAIRVGRDYGLRDRREAPQFMP